MTSMFLVIHHATFHCIPHMCSHLPQAIMHMFLQPINSSSQRHQSHTSEVARNLNLIDYRYFIGGRNQRQKRFSNTVENTELSINNHFYNPKRGKKKKTTFFSFTSNVSIPKQDTFLLPVAASIQNLSDKLKVIFLYVISYFKLAFPITN